MARYRFHCTNGSECVFDAHGQVVRRPAHLAGHADQVAGAVMGRLGPDADWSAWQVSVHDLEGRQVLVRAFPAGSEHGEALAA